MRTGLVKPHQGLLLSLGKGLAVALLHDPVGIDKILAVVSVHQRFHHADGP